MAEKGLQVALALRFEEQRGCGGGCAHNRRRGDGIGRRLLRAVLNAEESLFRAGAREREVVAIEPAERGKLVEKGKKVENLWRAVRAGDTWGEAWALKLSKRNKGLERYVWCQSECHVVLDVSKEVRLN